MGTEAKAKVVASIWGAKFVKFLATLAVLPWSIWKKRLNSSYSSKSTKAKKIAWQGIEQNLPLKQTQRPLPLLLSPSFFYATLELSKLRCWNWSRTDGGKSQDCRLTFFVWTSYFVILSMLSVWNSLFVCKNVFFLLFPTSRRQCFARNY